MIMRVKNFKRKMNRKLAIVIIALIVAAIFVGGCVERRPSLDKITSYANVYQNYTDTDLKKLKRFDIVVIEPYSVPSKQFLSDLKASGTIILAYISVGEANNTRRYWADWKPTDRSPDIPPR